MCLISSNADLIFLKRGKRADHSHPMQVKRQLLVSEPTIIAILPASWPCEDAFAMYIYVVPITSDVLVGVSREMIWES